MSAMAPGANANILQAKVLAVEATQTAELLRLRTELSTYNDELQAKLVAVDMAQQNGLAALQVLATEAANEIGTLR